MKIGSYQISGHALAGAGVSFTGILTVILPTLQFVQSSCPNLPPTWLSILGGLIAAIGAAITFTANKPQKVGP